VNTLKSIQEADAASSGGSGGETILIKLRQSNYNLRIFKQEMQVEEIVKMKNFKVKRILF